MPSLLEVQPAAVTELADAIVDVLNDGEFSQDIGTAKRFYTVEEALEKTTGLKIAIFKEATRRFSLTRKKKGLDVDIGVAVIRKLSTSEDTPDELELVGDAMHRLSAEIVDYLENTALEVDLNVRYLETTTRLLYSPAHLREQRLFLLPTTFTYRIFP